MANASNTLGGAVRASQILMGVAWDHAIDMRKTREALTGEELGPVMMNEPAPEGGALDTLNHALTEAAQLIETCARDVTVIRARLEL